MESIRSFRHFYFLQLSYQELGGLPQATIMCICAFCRLGFSQQQMGNQLCPANNKDILENFKNIEKGDKSVSDLVHFLAQRAKKDDSSLLSPEFDPKSQVIFTPVLKLRTDGILNSLDSDSEPSGYERILKKQEHQQPQAEEEKAFIADLQMPDNWRYTGLVLKGVPEGQGEEHGPQGEFYKGEFKNGSKEGQGEYRFSNSTVYKGQFKNNEMSGKGSLEFPNGDFFEGEFVGNLREGKGKYVPRQPNIDGLLFFEGDYVKDLKEGGGRLVYGSGEVSGRWRQGKYDYSFSS